MLLLRIIENNKIMLSSGHVRFSKSYFCAVGLRKGLGYGPFSVKTPCSRQKEDITPLQFIFNKSRSSILQRSVPDPFNLLLKQLFKKEYITYLKSMFMY